MNTLVFRLSGPLQSWGSGSMYDHRDTDDMPTKSGMIGLLAAAMGRSRDDSIEDLASLKFGVRVDAPGTRMTDFQITNMGDKLNANLSNRVYLCDATFLVGLSTENEAFLEQIEVACKKPVFSLCLGRRSCPPTLPFVLGIRNQGLYEALCDEPWQVPKWRQREFFRFSDSIPLRIVLDGLDGGALKRDVPISFSPFQREYGYRTVKEFDAKVISQPCDIVETGHDPMTELG